MAPTSAQKRPPSVGPPSENRPHGEEWEQADAMKGRLTPFERFNWLCGVLILCVLLPLTATTVASTVLWDALDRAFMGKPQDGVVMSFARLVNRKTAFLGKPFVRHPDDAFVVNVVLLLGVVVPGLFFASLYYTMQFGFNPYLCFAFHVFRLGPYFMNFAYCYTMCHKEGHSHLGLFAGKLNRPMSNVFNWWIGLFYGVMPSSFVYGHSINHHKYNNGPLDVVTTSDKPRDSFRNFVCYLPRWTLYAVNISTVRQFFSEGQYSTCVSMLTGNLYWATWFAAMYFVDPSFALWYVAFPVGENVLLLACINWCWHAFLSPDDPEDEFVGSVTILDSPINVLQENYHVVHHQYPGAHWTTHEERYEHHVKLGEYQSAPATMFRDTHVFELFFLIILREYDVMAEKFVDLGGKMDKAEKRRCICNRLRTCWWGPRRNLNIKLQGKEVGNHDMGHKVARAGIAE